MQFLGYGIFLVVIQEIASSSKSFYHGDNVLYFLGACFMFVALIIKGSDTGYEHVSNPFIKKDLWTIAYGICLPLISIIILVTIKVENRYTFGDFYELCEFGFPFASIMAMSTAMTWQLYNCNTPISPVMLSTHVPVTVCIAPFPMLAIVVLCMECVLKSHILDMFISLCMASAILDLAENPQDKNATISIVLTWIGLVIRMSLFLKQPKEKKKGGESEKLKEPAPVHVIDDDEELQEMA
jgi:hypothetical protein